MGGISGLISLLSMVTISFLSIGDPAPSLEGTQWLKGTAPVFKKQITVIEFWKNSCGNCRAQIPHMTSLQQKYGDRISIAALSKEPLETIEEFLKKNGDRMGFAVGKINKDLSEHYMTGIPGVPYAYVVNRDGLIIWKGHPSAIDEIIAKAVEGTVDVERLKKISDIEESLNAVLYSNDPEQIRPIFHELLEADPTNELALKVGIEVAIYDSEPGIIKEIFDKIQLAGLSGYKSNSFAKMLVTQSEIEYRYPEAALKFALHAIKEDPDNDEYMDTYANVLYCLGDIEKAIEWGKKALARNPNNNSYRSRLDYYLSIRKIREQDDYDASTRLQDLKTFK